MSHDASEVSWQALRQIVQKWAGTSAEIDEVRSLEGGSISTTVTIKTRAGDRAVLKLSPHRVDRSYEREAYQLDYLRSVGIPVPRVYETHIANLEMPDSYLLIEHMPGTNLHDALPDCTPQQQEEIQTELAEIVTRMHRVTSPHYGRLQNGSTVPVHHWPNFFRELYDPIWHEAEKAPHLPIKSHRMIAKLHERLDRWLAHEDQPRLTHGDLWSANVMVAPSDGGSWRVTALLDPNCTWAHAECELAYLDLFHTVSPAFNRAYYQFLPVGDEYHRVRKPIYQLYELLNNVQLYGEQYLKPLQAAVDKIAAFV